MSDRIESVSNDDADASDLESNDWEQDEVSDDELSESPLEDWGGGELEAAYLKALSALEASELEMPQESDEVIKSPRRSDTVNDDASESGHTALVMPANIDDSASIDESELASDFAPSTNTFEPVITTEESPPVVEVRPTPRQIIEACLFVGGNPLTSNRISVVLRGEFDADFVDREINELNRLYAVEERPYEIRLGEGGYRLTLRDEFERIRHKVYGLGPKEVRLSQEALEVLAVVAYHQPIKQARVEELGKPGCGPILRQLVRRELIAIARDPEHPKDVNYNTTPRFLSLFGIGSLEELPRHEQVTFK
jgi:segregation and condensation protein B